MYGLTVFLALVLILVGFFRLPGCMPNVGSNSIAIAAACHVASPQASPDPDVLPHSARLDQSVEMQSNPNPDLGGPAPSDSETAGLTSAWLPVSLAQRPLMWGVVQMPPGFYQKFAPPGSPVEHLAFGTVEDDVHPPVTGCLYA